MFLEGVLATWDGKDLLEERKRLNCQCLEAPEVAASGYGKGWAVVAYPGAIAGTGSTSCSHAWDQPLTISGAGKEFLSRQNGIGPRGFQSGGKEYQLVQDLRARNQIVQDTHPAGASPYTLLTSLKEEHERFTCTRFKGCLLLHTSGYTEPQHICF